MRIAIATCLFVLFSCTFLPPCESVRVQPFRYVFFHVCNVDYTSVSQLTFILFNATEDGDQIELPKGDYDLEEVKICVDDNPNNATLAEFKFVKKEVVIKTPFPLLKGGMYMMRIKSYFNMSTKESGYYSYRTSDLIYLVTSFKNRAPQLAIPCYDDPSQRPTMNLTVYKKYPRFSVFGTSKRVLVDNDQYTIFEPSLPVPAYLFNYFSGNTHQVRKLPDTTKTYSLSLNVRYALDYPFKSYFDGIFRDVSTFFDRIQWYLMVRFPQVDIDTVFLPHLSAEVRDSIGIMYYPEDLLNDRDKDWALLLMVSQKFSEQYFGTLVVPGVVEDNWMSYGMQEFLKYKNFIYEEEDILSVMEYYSLLPALVLDGFNGTLPMILADDSYVTREKAATIFRTLSEALTESVFRNFLKNYVTDWMYKPVTSLNLIDELVKQAPDLLKSQIPEYIRSYTENSGYPVIDVQINNKSFRVTQRQFSYNITAENDDTKLWRVPINYGSGSKKVMYESWLEKATDLIVPDDSAIIKGPVLVNYGWQGFYRVNYDMPTWGNILNLLHSPAFDTIPVENRAQLLDDALNLARAGLLHYDTAFQVAEYLDKENAFLPWGVAYENYKYLYNMIDGPFKENFADLEKIRKVIGEKVEHLFNDDVHTDWFKYPQRKELVMELSCMAKSRTCNKESTNAFQDNIKSLDPSIGDAIGCQVARKLDDMQWVYDFLASRENKLDFHRRRFYLRILPCSMNPMALMHLLEDALTLPSHADILSQYETHQLLSHIIKHTNNAMFCRVLAYIFEIGEDYEWDQTYKTNRRVIAQFIRDSVVRVHSPDVFWCHWRLLKQALQNGSIRNDEYPFLYGFSDQLVKARHAHINAIMNYLNTR